jgi:hypothetical protein
MSIPESRPQSILNLLSAIDMHKDITGSGVGEAYERVVREDPTLRGILRSELRGVTGPITPREVLDLQGDLAERLEPGADGTPSALGGFVDRLASVGSGIMDIDDGVLRSEYSRMAFEHVLTGRATRIGANMNDELHLRIQDEGLLHPELRFGLDVAPTRHRGFAVFEKPFWVPELRSREQAVHAVSWGFVPFSFEGRVQRGWVVTFWGDISRDVDPIVGDHLQMVGVDTYVAVYGRWSPIMTVPVIRGEAVGGPYVQITDDMRTSIISGGHAPNDSCYSIIRIIGALWSLLSETVAVESTQAPAKAPTKKIGRERRSVKDDVTVCVLRRPSRKTLHPGTGTKRSYRTWIEGGFTRTYWTGKNRLVPVVRVIGGYWSVDDENLPIKQKPRVDDLRR